MALTRLGRLLVQDGLLSEQDHSTIAALNSAGGNAFAKSILSLGLLAEEELSAFIAEKSPFRICAKDLKPHDLEGILRHVDKELVIRLEFMPLRIEDDLLTVGVLDPLDRGLIQQIEFFTGYRVQPHIITMGQLTGFLEQMQPGFKPQTSPIEELFASHADTAARRLIMATKDFKARSPEFFKPPAEPEAPPAKVAAPNVKAPAVDPHAELAADPGSMDLIEVSEPPHTPADKSDEIPEALPPTDDADAIPEPVIEEIGMDGAPAVAPDTATIAEPAADLSSDMATLAAATQGDFGDPAEPPILDEAAAAGETNAEVTPPDIAAVEDAPSIQTPEPTIQATNLASLQTVVSLQGPQLKIAAQLNRAILGLSMSAHRTDGMQRAATTLIGVGIQHGILIYLETGNQRHGLRWHGEAIEPWAEASLTTLPTEKLAAIPGDWTDVAKLAAIVPELVSSAAFPDSAQAYGCRLSADPNAKHIIALMSDPSDVALPATLRQQINALLRALLHLPV